MPEQTRLALIVDVTNKIVQTLAIIIAGAWALWTWGQTIAPSLKTGLTVTGEVGEFSWQDSQSACVGAVLVKIENNGQRNIDVARVEYQIFEAAPTRLGPSEKIKVAQTAPEPTDSALIKGTFPFLNGGYPPKAVFNWSVPVLLGSEITKQLWFKVEAFGPDNKRLEFWYALINPCGMAGPAPSPAPTR